MLWGYLRHLKKKGKSVARKKWVVDALRVFFVIMLNFSGPEIASKLEIL